jgi:hypothetical protein
MFHGKPVYIHTPYRLPALLPLLFKANDIYLIAVGD